MEQPIGQQIAGALLGAVLTLGAPYIVLASQEPLPGEPNVALGLLLLGSPLWLALGTIGGVNTVSLLACAMRGRAARPEVNLCGEET